MVASATGPDASRDSGNESGNEGWDVRESENLALEFLRGDMRIVLVRSVVTVHITRFPREFYQLFPCSYARQSVVEPATAQAQPHSPGTAWMNHRLATIATDTTSKIQLEYVVLLASMLVPATLLKDGL